ncbi:MAG: hypothetical protein GY926_23125 [bacterium]|nr:hypothetical protein [bacterium]
MAPGVTLAASQPTPQFNYADGIWNHGEGFAAAADTGGYHNFDDGTSVSLANISAQLPGLWEPFTVTNGGTTAVQRFVGELKPATYTGTEKWASFEVFAPITWDYSKPTMIVLSCQPTQLDNLYTLGGRFGYPGLSDPMYGLKALGGSVYRAQPTSDFVASFSGTADVDNFNIVAAYIVTPVGHRDLTLNIQRYLQLEQALQVMLTNLALAPPGFTPPGTALPDVRYPVVAVGGSMGGLSSQLLPMFFPQRFHGAVSLAFSGLLRRTATNQEMFTAVCSLSGFDHTGTAYTRRDTLGWSVFFRQFERYLTAKNPGAYDIDYLAGSFWAHWQAGQVVRPQYYVFSDEDGVTNGNEWLSLFEEERSGNAQSRACGYVIKPSAVPGRYKEMFWSIIDKGCHDSGNFEIPDSGGSCSLQSDPKRACFKFLKYAYASFQLDQTNPIPEHPDFGLVTAAGSGKDRYDAYRPFLRRAETSQRAASVTSPSPALLTEDSSFRDVNRGCGTWLGDDESLVVSGGYIYVGSADGIVTKLELDTSTQQLVIVQQSQSLGYGAWGLVDAGASSIVVGTYGKLWVLQKSNLAVTASLDLDWEESRPGRLQYVVDLFPSGSGEHIVFRSQFGQLVVASLGAGALTKVLSYGEPGIQDIVVGDTASGGYSKPIYLLSERGYVVKLGIGANNAVHLLAASKPQMGHPLDLEVFPGVGVYAFYGGKDLVAPLQDTLKIFDSNLNYLPVTPTDIGAHGGLRPGRRGAIPFIGDVEMLVAATGSAFIVLRGSLLSKVTHCGACRVQIELADFLPAAYPMAVKLGDLDSDGVPEIVISTEAGSVAWLPLTVLDGTGTVYDSIKAGASTSPLAYCTGVPVATWAMTESGPTAGKINAVDQCSRRWEIDGATGVATFQEFVPDSLTTPTAPEKVASKPFRDLGYLGFVPRNAALPVRPALHPTKPAVVLGVDLAVAAKKNSPIYVGQRLVTYFPLPPSWNLPDHEWVIPTHYQHFSAGFSTFHLAGDVLPGGAGFVDAYWWTGFPGLLSSPNSVWGIFGDATSVTHWASSKMLISAVTAHWAMEW